MYESLAHNDSLSFNDNVHLNPTQQAVVQIVREKYLDRIECKTEDELHQLLSELYTFLTDHMHQGLKKVCAYKNQRVKAGSQYDAERCVVSRQF